MRLVRLNFFREFFLILFILFKLLSAGGHATLRLRLRLRYA